MVPIISFVGKHDSGKTTLLTKVVNHLNNQNVKVGIIKHAHHDLEIPDSKDSEKLFNAGARVVYTNSPNMQITYTRAELKALPEIINAIASDLDIIILEGYKDELYPKIEVSREAISREFLPITNVVARVIDFKLEIDPGVPVFNFADINEIGDFILDYKY